MLRPLILVTYTAQLEHVMEKHNCQSHMYADDSKIGLHRRNSDAMTAVSRIENCVMEISGWMDSNRLKLNSSKTELIGFSTRQGFDKFTRATVGVLSSSVSPVNHVKNLAVTLDDQRKLSKHVLNVIRSFFYQIRQLKHIRPYLDFQSAASLVQSFVASRVDYCTGLLAAAPVKQMDQLQRVLNAVVRLLLRVSRSDFNLRVKVRDRLHFLRMPERVTFKLCATMYKCLQGMAPATSTSCAFNCALTSVEVIFDRGIKRS